MLSHLKEIPDAAGYYADLETGDIWSLRGAAPRKLAGGLSRGYRIYALQVSGRQVMRSGHRLVAAAAYGACPDGKECCHIDGNRLNNRADNLKWATPSENNGADKDATGRLLRGERHQNSKLTAADVRAIRILKAEGSITQSAMAVRYGVAEATISKILLGKAWAK